MPTDQTDTPVPIPPAAYVCPDGRLAVDLGHGRWLLVDHHGHMTVGRGELSTDTQRLAPVQRWELPPPAPSPVPPSNE